VQINKIAEPALLQPLVEPDQSSMVHQLPMINQMNCVHGHWKIIFPSVAKNFRSGGGNREISFFLIETEKRSFLLNI